MPKKLTKDYLIPSVFAFLGLICLVSSTTQSIMVWAKEPSQETKSVIYHDLDMTTDRGNLLFIRLKSDSKETDSKKFYITEQDATDIGSDWNKTVKITYYPSTNRIQSIKVVK